MATDTWFRTIFVLLITVITITQFAYRRARPKTKTELLITDRSVFVIPLWIASITLYPCKFGWFEYTIPLAHWLRVIGAFGLFACIPLSIWIYRELGVNFSPKLEIVTNQELVCSGPYRFVRHPMYATLIACVLSATLLSANLIVGVTSALVAIAMAYRTRKEDAMLLLRFTERYRQYMNRTNALVPRWR